MKKYINPYNLFVGSFIPNWLLRRTEISPGAKLCYARLSQFAGRDGECFPAQVTLAAEIGAGERQLRRYLSELEEWGLIEIVQVGLNQPNRYRFLWHTWMEEKVVKKEPSGKGGKRTDCPDRTYVTAPDRTNSSRQERPLTTAKENHLRDSSKKTTTKEVVADEKTIEKLRRTLAPEYAEIPDTVLVHLIEKKGIEHVLSIAHQTAYQLNHKSTPPENPTGHFVALTMQGMNVPRGYKSPEELAQSKKAMRMRAACRRKETEKAREEQIPLEDIQEFLKNFLGRENAGTKRIH